MARHHLNMLLQIRLIIIFLWSNYKKSNKKRNMRLAEFKIKEIYTPRFTNVYTHEYAYFMPQV